MKKLLNLVFLVGLFVAFATTDALSQEVINQTDCDFRVSVDYDINCNYAGSQVIDVPANSSVVLTVPFGAQITESKGHPIGVNCVYRIGSPNCSTFPLTSSPTCISFSPCSNYTATLAPFNHIILE